MTLFKPNFPGFKNLNGKRVILASTSPRRIGIFTNMGLDFEVVPSNFEEDYDKSLFSSPAAYSAATCLKKAQIVLEMVKNDPEVPSLIVSSDTIVVCNGVIYEKPIDRDDAVRMLREFSGATIEVISAVSILYRSACGGSTFSVKCFEDITEMHMETYDQAMIDAYLDTGDGMSYSGALAYQGNAFLLVRGIKGCFYNLIGFPAPRFYQELTLIAHLIA